MRHPIYPVLIENSYYKIEFRHDWPFPTSLIDSDREAYQILYMKSKYKKKIARFRNLNQYLGKVFFIRTAWDLALDSNHFWNQEGIGKITIFQAKELKNALDCFFPDLDFILVIVNYEEENDQIIKEINGILEFKIRRAHKSEDYRNMYTALQELSI